MTDEKTTVERRLTKVEFSLTSLVGELKELKEAVMENTRAIRGIDDQPGLIGRVLQLEKVVDIILKFTITVFLAGLTALVGITINWIVNGGLITVP